MTIANPAALFSSVRAGLLGPTLDTAEVGGLNAILAALEGLPLAHVAYALATAYHETAHTMQPVKEFGGPAYFFRMYDKAGNRPEVAARLGNSHPGDGALYAGRGYVQLTGRANYSRADAELGLSGELVAHPDLAMRPDVAAKIMRAGMVEGWFCGKSFASYLPAAGPASFGAFVLSRKIINGQDRAADIAGYAVKFQEALEVGGWA